jgi:hypothetical protein
MESFPRIMSENRVEKRDKRVQRECTSDETLDQTHWTQDLPVLGLLMAWDGLTGCFNPGPLDE